MRSNVKAHRVPVEILSLGAYMCQIRLEGDFNRPDKVENNVGLECSNCKVRRVYFHEESQDVCHSEVYYHLPDMF